MGQLAVQAHVAQLVWPGVVRGFWFGVRVSGRTREVRSQLNVGRQYDNRVRITVQSRLTPNIGLEGFPELHTLESVRPIPA
jgi:hypothetical protein